MVKANLFLKKNFFANKWFLEEGGWQKPTPRAPKMRATGRYSMKLGCTQLRQMTVVFSEMQSHGHPENKKKEAFALSKEKDHYSLPAPAAIFAKGREISKLRRHRVRNVRSGPSAQNGRRSVLLDTSSYWLIEKKKWWPETTVF